MHFRVFVIADRENNLSVMEAKEILLNVCIGSSIEDFALTVSGFGLQDRDWFYPFEQRGKKNLTIVNKANELGCFVERVGEQLVVLNGFNNAFDFIGETYNLGNALKVTLLIMDLLYPLL